MQIQQLKTIFLEQDFKRAAAKLEGEFADPTHVERMIRKTGLILAPDGEFVALFLKKCLDIDLEEAYCACMTVDDLIDKRPAFVGSASLLRIKKDGHLGKYHAVPAAALKLLDAADARQGLLGARRGTSARPAELTTLTKKSPLLLDLLRTVIEEADRNYAAYLPGHRNIQLAALQRAPKFQLWRTAFSSAYIPKNHRSGYHFDSGNLPGGLSVLLPLGTFLGGELVLPRWRIALALRPGDLAIFDAVRFLHWNLPIMGIRASQVLYCADGLHQ